MDTFSINSTFTELVELLGATLRIGLGFKVLYPPCWDFKFQEEVLRHQMYSAKGRFFSKIAKEDCHPQGGSEDTVSVRAQCILTDGPYPNVWVFLVWVKLPNGVIRSYCFEKADWGLPQLSTRQTAPDLPPEELKFK